MNQVLYLRLYWISGYNSKLSLYLIYKCMKKITRPPKLADQLRIMAVGEITEIGIEHYMSSTIRNVVSRIQKQTDLKFKVTTKGVRFSTIVERIA